VHHVYKVLEILIFQKIAKSCQLTERKHQQNCLLYNTHMMFCVSYDANFMAIWRWILNLSEGLNRQRHRGPRHMTNLHALSLMPCRHGVTRMRCCLLVWLTPNRGISKSCAAWYVQTTNTDILITNLNNYVEQCKSHEIIYMHSSVLI
jgi:hypothetical protein